MSANWDVLDKTKYDFSTAYITTITSTWNEIRITSEYQFSVSNNKHIKCTSNKLTDKTAINNYDRG